MAYRVKKAFQNMPQLNAVIDGRRVALNEAFTYTKRGTPTTPPKTVNVPLATQAQLKVLFDRGEPCVEQYQEVKAAEAPKVEVKKDEPIKDEPKQL